MTRLKSLPPCPALIAAVACLLPNFCAHAADPVLITTESRDWIVTVKFDGQSFPIRRIIGDGKTPGFRVSTSFAFDAATFVYPVLQSSATHEMTADTVVSSLSVDGIVHDTTAELLPDYQAGERLGKWDLPALRGNLLRFSLEIPMTTRSVAFDEARAGKIKWPEEPWPPLVASALLPQLFVESDSDIVRDRVARWTNKNPGAYRPATLAKVLMARVIESVRTTTDLGYVHGRNGELSGFEIQGAAETLRTGQGTPFDLAATLCAVYRAAGLPARVVIGYDLAASLGDRLGIIDTHPQCEHDSNIGPGRSISTVRAWVEFYLPTGAGPDGAGEWIPVDPYRQRRVSSRTPALDRPWDFFGNHVCLVNVAPLSFHFHPPTTVVNSGPPAIWGWLPLPDAPVIEQRLDFSAREPITRGSDR